MEGRHLMPPARKFPRRPSVADVDKREAIDPVVLQIQMKAKLRDFLEPFTTEWNENFRPIALVAECTKIVDNAISGDEPVPAFSRARYLLPPQPDLLDYGKTTLQDEKDFTPREGSISRRGRYFEEDERMTEESFGALSKSTSLPSFTTSGSLPHSATFTTSEEEDAPSCSHRRFSLPRTDSVSSLQDVFGPLTRTESLTSIRDAVESRPPLSKVPRSFSGIVNELSPIPLAPLFEVPSPTKSEASPSKMKKIVIKASILILQKDQKYSTNEISQYDDSLLTPDAAKTSRTFGIPEVKGKKRGLAAGVEKLVRKWEDLTAKKK